MPSQSRPPSEVANVDLNERGCNMALNDKTQDNDKTQEMGNFESDFTWSDVKIVDDTESLFFGGSAAAKM